MSRHFQIDRSRVSLSQILNKDEAENTKHESVTTATVKSLDRSAFFNGRGKHSKRNRNNVPFKKHRTRRINPGITPIPIFIIFDGHIDKMTGIARNCSFLILLFIRKR